MKKIRQFLPFMMILIGLTLLASCSSLTSLYSSDTTDVTATPTIIVLPTQLGVQTRVESLTCEITQQVAIQTDDKQGDLMSWSPDNDQLALVQPTNQYYGWYIGDIVVYDTTAKEIVFTSKDSAVFGDITWAPNGSEIAYVELDQDAGVYTVKTVALDGSDAIDIFGDAENARTDDYASKKGILSWDSQANLIVTSICGSDCVRKYQYNAVSQTLNEQDEIRYNDNTSLDISEDVISPDGNWQVYTDEKDNVWLSDLSGNQVSLLLQGTGLEEVKFSKDSKYLAIRTAEQVQVYQLGCSPQ
jgi:hypothetical protein